MSSSKSSNIVVGRYRHRYPFCRLAALGASPCFLLAAAQAANCDRDASTRGASGEGCPLEGVVAVDRGFSAPPTTLSSPADSAVVLVLDLTGMGSTLNRAALSLRHTLDAFGIPYRLTTDPSSAGESESMLLVAGSLEAIPVAQRQAIQSQLADWIGGSTGRTLWLFREANLDWLSDVPVTAGESSTQRTSIELFADHALCSYADAVEEHSVPVPALGDGSRHVRTLSYVVDEGGAVWQPSIVATYDDGQSAIVSLEAPATGARVVLAGFVVEDFLFRMQYEKGTVPSGGVSPGAFSGGMDSLRLLLRSSYERWTEHPSLRAFAEGGRAAAVILTHDVDSTSGFAVLAEQLLPLERSIGVTSTLFVTTCNRDNGWISPFFDNADHQGVLQEALADGWDVQSHTVSHLSDMARWDEGEHVLRAADYAPDWDSATASTIGGSAWAEAALSAGLLHSCVGGDAVAWRSAYLNSPMELGGILESLGYLVSSSVRSTTVGGSFPFPMIADRSSQADGDETPVLQLPIAVSDYGIADLDPDVVAEGWLDVTRKNAANNAPTVILVHPTDDGVHLEAYAAYLEQVLQDPGLWVTNLTDWYRWYRGQGIRSEVLQVPEQ